jgi:hypothetical protein
MRFIELKVKREGQLSDHATMTVNVEQIVSVRYDNGDCYIDLINNRTYTVLDKTYEEIAKAMDYIAGSACKGRKFIPSDIK